MGKLLESWPIPPVCSAQKPKRNVMKVQNYPHSPLPTFPAATVPPGINGRLCALDRFQLFKAPPLSFI
jgi:hypothetical protein